MDPADLDPSTDEYQLRAEGLWGRQNDMLREAAALRKKPGPPKGFVMSPEHREAIRKAKLGKPLSAAHKKALSKGQKKRYTRQSERNAARMRQYIGGYFRQNPDYEYEAEKLDRQDKINAERLAAIEARRETALRKVLDEVDASGLGPVLDGQPESMSPADVLALSRVVLSGLMGRPVPGAQDLTLRGQKAAPPAPRPESVPGEAPPSLARKVLGRASAPGYVLPGGERKLLSHALLNDPSLNDADRALIQEVLARA